MSGSRSYYEEFWRGPEGEAVESDPLTFVRLGMFAERFVKGLRVLDAGCGSGTTTSGLTELGYEAVGVELSREAARVARHRCSAPIVQGGLEGNIPFASGSFDAVYCTDVLEHLLDAQGSTQEFARLLKPGGRVFASVPFHGFVKNLLVAALAFDRHFDPRGPHIRFFSVTTFRRLFEDVGLRVLEVRKVGRFWPIYQNMVLVAEKPQV